MNPEAAVSELFAAFAARDPERAARVLHPDCTFWAEGTSTAAGRIEPYHGPEGVQDYFADAARLWEHLEVHPQDVRTAGAGVICFGV
ncbi:MAG: nuclear transport factor 2 family protein, partial [Solirubrobacterales bacterium]|nr:nuclear transport factor 2 family protein [Solirubrobacterales bacterium]